MNPKIGGPKRPNYGPRPITDGVVSTKSHQHRLGTKTDLRSFKTRIKQRRKAIITVSAAIVLVLSGAATFYLVNRPHYVVDDAKGLKFQIPDGFDEISSTDLKKLNPFNAYGFKPGNVGGVMCVISQTQREKPGRVALEALRDGAFGQIKIQYPDAKPLGYKPIKMKNGREAASFDISYTDNAAAYRQAEIVTTTNKTATFAYCTGPEKGFSQYQPEFNKFFSSLEIY